MRRDSRREQLTRTNRRSGRHAMRACHRYSRPMTEPTRGARARRGNRRPGSLLLTALLVLAIVASSALVFTDRVELLKLAVIVALWAAVVAAFVSFIYRRQADLDQAKSRDLKLVYDLQLDREISARREYELSDRDAAAARTRLGAAGRRPPTRWPACARSWRRCARTSRSSSTPICRAGPPSRTSAPRCTRFGDWDGVGQRAAAPERDDRSVGPGRVISSRIDTERRPRTSTATPTPRKARSSTCPPEPQPPGDEWAPQDAGRRAPAGLRAGARPTAGGDRRPPRSPRPEGRRRGRPEPDSAPPPETRLPWLPPESPPPPPPRATRRHRRRSRHEPAAPGTSRRGRSGGPRPAAGQFIPAGVPGSNWAVPAAENAAGRRRRPRRRRRTGTDTATRRRR